jgi:myosin heavy subunit
VSTGRFLVPQTSGAMDVAMVWLPAGQVRSWAGDDECLWRAATITSESTGDGGVQLCTCITCDGDEQAESTLPREDLLLRDVLPPDGIEDLVSLGNLHAPAILDNLRLRFLQPESEAPRQRSIYTYCGNICIAINPYERLTALYSQETRQSYIGQQSFSDNPPHIYAVAEAAYSNMIRSGSAENQSILVSGESGAGKTESVKIMMNYLANRNQRQVDSESVTEAVIRSNPLLETFGNSKTLRNNNSSRFGKFTQILFDSDGNIVGSRVDVYLLEKSRVVRQLVGERNFHIFYQLLVATADSLPGSGPHGASSDSLTREELGLPGSATVEHATHYQYLSGSESFVSEGIDDYEWYVEMTETMRVIGVTTTEQQEMLRVVAGRARLSTCA